MKTYKINYNFNNLQTAGSLVNMPQICCGLLNHTFELTNNHEIISNNITNAISVGYRHFDGADLYGDDEYKKQIGEALLKSGLNREEYWITWKGDNIKNINNVIKTLNCNYIDLYLIHHGCGNESDWDELKKLKTDGKIKNWGVSNCENINKLKTLKDNYDIYANQIQARPPKGKVNGRDKHDNLIQEINNLGIKVMLFGTISGITNLNNYSLVYKNVEDKQINKYYIQKYLTKHNGNVLMVGSNSNNIENLKTNFDDLKKYLDYELPLLEVDELNNIEENIKGITLNYQ